MDAFEIIGLCFGLCPTMMAIWASTSFPNNKLEKWINRISGFICLLSLIVLLVVCKLDTAH